MENIDLQFNYFDIHSHFNLEKFDGDLDDAIKTLEEKNVGTFCVGVNKDTSKRAVEIAKMSPNIYATVGLHPLYVVEETDFDYNFYADLATDGRVVCVGECGLDYFRIHDGDEVGKDAQKKVFNEQVDLAIELNLPLMLHVRASVGTYDAYEDILEILEKRKVEAGDNLRGDAHFFVATKEIADRFISLGFTVSFTGVLTITEDYNDVVAHVPLENMMAETDAPYVAPTPYRGKRCEPWMVEEVYKKIAEIKEIEVSELVEILNQNRKRMFKV